LQHHKVIAKVDAVLKENRALDVLPNPEHWGLTREKDVRLSLRALGKLSRALPKKRDSLFECGFRPS
jgi:hypothetical protein